jgi:hypothetical protein
MPVSLHTASVGTYLQILPSIAGLIDKAEAHCRENGLSDEALTGATLAADMWPLAKQITSALQHSAGTIAALKTGVIGPDFTPAPEDFATLRGRVADAISALQAVAPEDFEAMAGGDMRFEIGERRMEFTAEDFLLTFSLPNFYFHASTAYAILRGQGLKIGKMDFMGRPRMKG